MRTDTKLFAGEPVPKNVTKWAIFNAEGQRMMAAGGEGVEIGEFAIELLSVENILSTWGPGQYRIQWIGVRRGGDVGARGSRVVKVVAPPSSAAASVPAEPDPPPVDVAASDPLAGAFRIVDAIDRRAAIQAERDRDFLRAVLAARPERQQPARDPELVAALGQIAGVVRQLGARVDELEGETEDPDDDDDEPDAGSGPFRKGESIKDTVIVETLNGIAGMISEATPLVKMAVAAKLEEAAERARREAEAQQAQQRANGAASLGAGVEGSSAEAVG